MRIFYLLAATFISVPVAAQSVYLPLEIGNEWTYYTLIDPPGQPYDTLKAGTFSVRDSVETDGRTYLLFGHPEAFADTVRADSSGRIWAWKQGKEHLYFDFTAPDSSTYSFPISGDDLEYTVTVRRGQSVETRAGIFEDCIRFDFDVPEVLDDARSFYFAPGVGIVYTVGGMGEPSWLYAARIGGRAIPTAVIPIERFSFSASAYPNPSKGDVTLRFILETSARAKITVYDVIGRRLTTVADRHFAAGAHEIGWSVESRPGGIYFIVLESDEQRVTRPISVTR